MTKSLTICAAIGLSLLTSACAVQATDYNALNRRVTQERELNDQYKNELLRKDKRLAEVEAANVKWQDAYNALKDSASAEPVVVEHGSVDKALADLRNGITSSLGNNTGFNVVEASHAVGVRMDDGADVLFMPGSWKLTEKAEANVNTLADAVKKTLESNPNYIVRVDGHTDSDPVRRAKAQGIEDNTHLGFMRAHTVAKALVARGIPASKVAVLSAGEHLPVGGEKKLNRRVEVWVSTPEGFSFGTGKQSPAPSVSR